MEEDELHSHEPPDQSGPPEGLFKPRMSLIRTPPRGEACSGDLSESDSTVKPGDSQEELLDCAAIVQIGGEFPAVDKNTSRQQDAESTNKSPSWKTNQQKTKTVNKNTQNLSNKQPTISPRPLTNQPKDNFTNFSSSLSANSENPKIKRNNLFSTTNVKTKMSDGIPPIIIDKTTTYKVVQNLIKNSKSNCVFKNLCSGDYRLQPESIGDFNLIKQLLEEKTIPHYTYQQNKDKKSSFIIRGLHPETDIEDLTLELKSLGHEVARIQNASDKETKAPTKIFFIDLFKKSNNMDFLSLVKIQNTIVVTELPRSKNEVPRCGNCQSYFHTRNYCSLPPVCRFCALNHLSKDCTLDTTSNSEKFKCALCGLGHIAAEKGKCEALSEILKRKQKSTTTKQNPQGKPKKSPPPVVEAITAFPELPAPLASRAQAPRSQKESAPGEGQFQRQRTLASIVASETHPVTEKKAISVLTTKSNTIESQLEKLTETMVNCMEMMSKLMNLLTLMISNKIISQTSSPVTLPEKTKNSETTPQKEASSSQSTSSTASSPNILPVETPKVRISTRAKLKQLQPPLQSQSLK